jgi:hypothetical protein
MAFTLSFDSPAPVDDVLAAIREETREWRESAMPEHLRALGHVKVFGRVKKHQFTLGYESTGADRVPVELTGMVSPSDHGSHIEAACGRPSWWIGSAVFAAVGIVTGLAGGSGGAIALTVACILGVILYARHASVSREASVEGRYLAERLERAIARTARAAG